MESKQRTPLALAIEELQTSLSLIKVTTEYAEGYYYGIENALRILRNLKPKERERFESFASDYYISPIVGPSNLFNECLTQE